MITLLTTPHCRQGSTTASMSRSTVRRSPDLSAPMLITMSISVAPSKIARRVSYCLTSAVVAPSGNPTTEQTPTPVPRSRAAASATQAGFTHTVAKWNSAASRHSFSISARVASGLSSVWSISAGDAARSAAAGVDADPRRAGVEHAAQPVGAAIERHRVAAALPRQRTRPAALRRHHLLGDDVDEPLEILWVRA